VPSERKASMALRAFADQRYFSSKNINLFDRKKTGEHKSLDLGEFAMFEESQLCIGTTKILMIGESADPGKSAERSSDASGYSTVCEKLWPSWK